MRRHIEVTHIFNDNKARRTVVTVRIRQPRIAFADATLTKLITRTGQEVLKSMEAKNAEFRKGLKFHIYDEGFEDDEPLPQLVPPRAKVVWSDRK